MLAASACAGAPVEAGPTSEDTTAATEFPTTMPGTTNATTLETSPSASASASDSVDATSADPATTSSDATTATTADTGAETTNATSETTADPSVGTSGDDAESGEESESDAETGEALGGCLGRPLPEQAPAECSDNSSTAAQLEVVNGCAYAIDVYWVGYDCGESHYATIGPAEGWATNSYETHPWRVRDAASNDLLLEIMPLVGDTMLTVQ